MEYIRKIEKEIEDLHSKVSRENWFEFNKLQFLRNAKISSDNLQEIRQMIEKLGETLDFEIGAPEGKDIITNIKKMENVLLNNLHLESGKTGEEAIGELYSDLQNKILLILLQAKHYLEKTKIHKHTKEPAEKNSKILVDTLQKKTSELEDLKSKYENLRRKSYFGIIPEETYIDLGSQIEEARVSIESSLEAYKKENEISKKELKEFLKSLEEKEVEFGKVHNHLREYLKIAGEYIKNLKKEKDFAQKTVIELESESSGIRSKYLDSILGIEKEKHLHRQDVEQKTEEKYSKIAEENRELRELTNRLREINSNYDRKIRLLEEENKNFRSLVESPKKQERLMDEFNPRKMEE